MGFHLVIIPIAVYFLLTLFLLKSSDFKGVFSAFVKAHLLIFAFITVSTELLSIYRAISFSNLLFIWLLFLFFLSIAAFSSLRGKRQKLDLKFAIQIERQQGALCFIVIFILGLTFMTALLYPPNTWDSMSYHMPRVAHWISNGSVSFYPTSIIRQNFQAPLSEFAILHLQVLTGGDFFANLVQWTSFVVLVCLCFLIADEMGLSVCQKFVSAAIIVTLPMAILQASSTQNDLVVSVFILSFTLFMLRIRNRLSVDNCIYAAIALGLAVLTKATAYIYCSVIGLSFAISILWEYRYQYIQFVRLSAVLTMIVIASILLNIGHLYRNYSLYGNPLSSEGQKYLNRDLSPIALFVNATRNVVMHLGLQSPRINQRIEDVMEVVFGKHLNNPKSTLPGTSFSIPYRRHEDSSGNLIHMAIILISLMVLPILWMKGRYHGTFIYTITLMGCAAFYCCLMQWQPWASRLHTPLFAMAAPLIAVTITSGTRTGIRRIIPYITIVLIVIHGLPFALANSSRSIINLRWLNQYRMGLYFENRPQLYHDYRKATNILRNAKVKEAGLYIGGNGWEYPLWVFLMGKNCNDKNITFKHVGVQNISWMAGENSFLPMYVVTTKDIRDWRHGHQYTPVFTSNSIGVSKRI